MANFSVKYLGDLRCQATHTPSGATFVTDAMKDQEGISPTDLLAASLATCTASMMGMFAKNHQIDIDGMEMSVERIMNETTHQIQKIVLTVTFLNPISDLDQQKLTAAAKGCPVKKALIPDLEIELVFKK